MYCISFFKSELTGITLKKKSSGTKSYNTRDTAQTTIHCSTHHAPLNPPCTTQPIAHHSTHHAPLNPPCTTQTCTPPNILLFVVVWMWLPRCGLKVPYTSPGHCRKEAGNVCRSWLERPAETRHDWTRPHCENL